MSTATGVNKVILLGEVTVEPVISNAGGFVKEWRFTIITHEMVKRGNAKLPHVETHQIIAPKALIEGIIGKLKTGTKVYLEGRVETVTYTDGQGIRRYETSISATRIEFPSLAIAG